MPTLARMACQLELDTIKTFPGQTLFSSAKSNCLKPTSVYVSAKHADTDNALDVVLFLHGFYVKNLKFLFHSDPTRLREQVRDSGKDVVLIAPFLGYEYADGDTFAGDYSVKGLAETDFGERYLDEVLAAMAAFRNPTSPPDLTVRSLTIAGHSGGGAGIRNLYGNLGKYRAQLKECWGLDCLYGMKASPDDATFWHDAMLKSDAVPLYFFYGPSTIRQSVKLDLMGRGLANSLGDMADPPTHMPIANLHVEIGQAVVGDIDKLMFPTPFKPKPVPKGAKPARGEYAATAASNLRSKVRFNDDIHYIIARDFLLARLKAATYL